jgi:hypothetical protein
MSSQTMHELLQESVNTSRTMKIHRSRCMGLVQVFAAPELQLAAEEAQRLHSVQEAQSLLQYVDRENQGHLQESDRSTT